MMMHHNHALFCFFLISSSLFLPSKCLLPPHKSRTRGMFVFGSSVVDNGNNNFIPNNSLLRVDYLPYGIDFPLGPTGRYTNGENIGDKIGKELCLPNYLPPFNDPSTNGSKIIHGVNYASGGSGILDNTGTIAGNVISLNQQIRNFEVTLPELEMQLGQNKSQFLSEFLFLVQTGGNDYSLNYFLNLTNSNVSVEAFTANLTSTFTLQLKRLYSLGARKFVLVAINPSGCAPVTRARNPGSEGCVEIVNRAVELFNVQLRNLTDVLKPELPGSNLVFVNAYKIIRDIIRYPILKGFHNVTGPCCALGVTGNLCARGGSVCSNRREYVYFDGLHTTDAVNGVIATKAFYSILSSEVYPYNVKRLSQI